MVVMRWVAFIPLIVLFLLSANIVQAKDTGASNIWITKAEPAPNYRNTLDSLDIEQLTDGVKNSFPIWTKKNSVGWSGESTVSLTIARKSSYPINGTLRIHSAKSSRSGVFLPRRLDLYGVEGRSVYHIGFTEIADQEIKDRDSHVIELRLNSLAGNKFILVLRSNGKFLMIDEIELFEEELLERSTKDKEIISTSVVLDSTARYKKSILQRDKGVIKKQMGGVTLVNPWSDWGNGPEGLHKWSVAGATGKRYIGIYAAQYRTLVLTWSDLLLEESAQLYKVEKILTAAEKAVYDLLVPVNGWRVSNDGSGSFYIVEISLDNIKEGDSNLFLTVDGYEENERERFRFPIAVKKSRITEDCDATAHVNLWAYRSDKPIWERPEAVLSELLGINRYVAVISPREIRAYEKNFDKQLNRLKKELAFYKEAQKILIYLAWDKSFVSEGGVDRRWIERWIRGVVRVTEQLGLERGRWAIYPVDEPDAKTYPIFLDILRTIKEIDESVQVYANPIYPETSSEQLSKYQLKKAGRFVDIWQPDYRLAKKYRDFFAKWGDSYWVYEVPEYPAKAVSPEWYENIPARARKVGASGVGFWSFSDTGKTSAKNDFDGRRADYAVVYDSDSGTYLPSRRWFAFLEGLAEDRDLACGF